MYINILYNCSTLLIFYFSYNYDIIHIVNNSYYIIIYLIIFRKLKFLSINLSINSFYYYEIKNSFSAFFYSFSHGF